jgi:uncharacterized protein (DUF433 family)
MASAAELAEVVTSSGDVMSGTPVFQGTRVPVQALLDHLEAGETLDAFLLEFPTVGREKAVRILELAGQAAVASLSANPSEDSS